jgi:hypothetical protein
MVWKEENQEYERPSLPDTRPDTSPELDQVPDQDAPSSDEVVQLDSDTPVPDLPSTAAGDSWDLSTIAWYAVPVRFSLQLNNYVLNPQPS